jgi:hypothetical protein
MSVRVTNIRIHSTPREGVYFFDSNIWLLLLGIEPNLKDHQEKYIAYFKAVTKTSSVILLPALLVGEIIGKKVRTEMKKYAKKKGDPIDETYFKQKFRHTPQFISTIQSIYDDIDIYASSCTLINDKFGMAGFKKADLLVTTTPIKEFNDNYLYRLAVDNSAIIVTHDADFLLPGVEIHTLNNSMLI